MVYRLTGFAIVENGGASAATVLDIANGANQDVTVGFGAWRFTVNANGSFAVATANGELTARHATQV
jgi:hypothetical protein